MKNADKSSFDFPMATDPYNDLTLRTIAKEAVGFLFKYVGSKKIIRIILTGSVANGEGTVIRHGSQLIVSDFDFVIWLSFPNFVRSKAYLPGLALLISKKLEERGINTHVTFTPVTYIFGTSFCNAWPRIYEYEFTLASKCITGKTPSFDKKARPSEKDALELVFSVIGDLMFLKLRKVSKVEESYIYGKRALTLLNSMLIIHGFFGETYQKRLEVAKKYANRRFFPITRDEIRILEIFTQYKLNGSNGYLMGSLGFKKIDALIMFQREFLKKVTIKTLYYGLFKILNKSIETNLAYDDLALSKLNEISLLLEEYLRRSEAPLLVRVTKVALTLIGLSGRRNEEKKLVCIYMHNKKPLKTILNVVIALLFVDNYSLSTKIMRKTLPCIFPYGNAVNIKKIYSLWQIA
jgi:hypothetical protein